VNEGELELEKLIDEEDVRIDTRNAPRDNQSTINVTPINNSVEIAD
jgi:hypothetical protein